MELYFVLQDDLNPFQIFVGIIYSKGAYTLHMLRGVLGDSVFFNCLYNYSTNANFMYDHATTEDFQAGCESISGMDLNFFFDQWIYDEYYPQYQYSFEQNSSNYTAHVNIQQIQNSVGRREVFKMPIQLLFNFVDNSDTLITVWNDQQTQLFQFNFSKQLSTVDFDPDEWILRTVQQVVDGVLENPHSTPDKFSLLQNYPNPFNPSTTIEFSIPKAEFITLKIHNVLGQEVATLVSDKFTPGTYKYTWDASSFASGVYYYRIAIHPDKIAADSYGETDNPSTGSGQRFVQTRKLILMK